MYIKQSVKQMLIIWLYNIFVTYFSIFATAF